MARVGRGGGGGAGEEDEIDDCQSIPNLSRK